MTSPSRFGKYQLVRRIGVGGMAEVYEASLLGPAGFSKRLALKLLLPRLQKQPDLVAMFIDEASIAAGLDHPNVVAVYEFGENAGTYFMVMEYIDGWELAEVEQCCVGKQRPMPVRLAAYVVRELCRGLAYIHGHERGIVHRDVSPHNIFVGRLGQVKLADFGIAKAAARRTHTEAGHIKGKLAYLAPEQATGELVTARTDIYAAGLILFELLTGRRFIQAGSEVEHIVAAMNPPRLAPSSICPEAAPLDAIAARALERHPVMRYASAATMADDLDRFLEAAPVRSDELAVFVADVTAGSRQAADIAPPAADIAPPSDGSSAAAALQDITLSPSTSSRPSLLTVPKHRLSLWIALLAVSLLGAGAALLWRSAGRGAGANGALPAAHDATAAASGQPEGSVSAIDARSSRADVRGPVADAERRPLRPVHKKHKTERPLVRTPPRHPDAAPAGPSAAEIARARRQRLQSGLDTLLQQARSRGLFPGDDAEADRALSQARSALQASTFDEADTALTRLRGRVQAFQIDRSFAERKLRRLEKSIAAAAARLPEADRQRMATVSQGILRLIMDSRLVEASAQMSRALAELARR